MHGFADLAISFYTRGTASGFDTGTWSWSIDGTNFTILPGVNTATRNTNFIFRQVDFSSFTQLNEADLVTLRYTLSGASGNSSNNRIDDFTITATSNSVGDQLRTVQVSASDATASETDSDPGVFLFRINGIANPGGLVIGFAVSGTATPPGLAGADYDFEGAASFNPGSLTGTIIIPEGANAATLRVLPVSDEIFEGAETAIVTIQPQPGYLVGQNASAIVNITERPPNDFFVDATPLPGSTPSAMGTNAGASSEPGEPNHANVTGGKSVWWRWTAPATASMRVATTGSNFDTLLAIYTGGAVNALTLIAANNDANGTPQSQLTFSAVAGVTYQIAVDGVGGASGNINLVFSFPSPPPPNDFFADSIFLGGNSPSVTGTNISATREAGEPSHNGFSSGHSVWYRWVAPLNGYAVISTAGSNYDTVLAVYTGTAVNALTLIAVNDDANATLESQVAFAVSAGVTYRIAVDGSSGAEGNFALAINGSLPLPRASISTTDASAAEEPIDTASFRISLNAAQPNPVSVNVTLGGTATLGVDYVTDTPLNGNTAVVVLDPTQTQRIVTLTPLSDEEYTEFDETILPGLAAGSGYQVSSGTPQTIVLHDHTPYNSAWAQQFGPAFTGAAAHPLADPNGNGVSNLLEFAFNGNPLAAGDLFMNGFPLLPVVGFGYYPDPNDGNIIKLYPTLTFNRRTDAGQLGYLVQLNGSLPGSWLPSGAVLVDASTAGMPPGMERAVFRSAFPASDAGALTPQFLRVQITAP